MSGARSRRPPTAALWTVLAALGALSTAAAAAPPSNPTPPPAEPVPREALVEVPEPAIENLEQAVQEQLLETRALLDAVVARADVPAERLAVAYGGTGQLYFVNDLSASAEACFVNARLLAPDDYRWHYYLGVLYALEGDLEASIASFERAAELAPEDLPTRVRLARVAIDRGDLELAARAADAALAIDPASAAAAFERARVHELEGDLEAAIAGFERALELQPEANAIHHFLGMAHRRRGDLEKAREHLALNRHQEPRFPDPLVEGLVGLIVSARLHFNNGIDLMRAGRLEEGIEQLRLAVEMDPDDFLARHNLAGGLVLAGREEEGLVEYRKTVEINPSYRNARYNLATLLARRGDLEEAAAEFEAAYQIDPEDEIARLEWATALALLGRRAEALELLEELVAEHPDLAKARLHLGNLLIQLGRPQQAETSFRELLAAGLSPTDEAMARLALADLLAARGGSEAAAGVEALEHYRRAAALAPDAKEARAGLAAALARDGRFAEAAEEYAAAVELEPGNFGHHFGRALSLLLAGRDADARAALGEGLEAHSESVPLIHLLARLLATSEDPAVRDGDRALELARRALDREPALEHAETVAMALAELGRFDEAVAWQRRVLTEAARAGGPSPAMRRRLALYERGEPCRSPWRDD